MLFTCLKKGWGWEVKQKHYEAWTNNSTHGGWWGCGVKQNHYEAWTNNSTHGGPTIEILDDQILFIYVISLHVFYSNTIHLPSHYFHFETFRFKFVSRFSLETTFIGKVINNKY